jgi:Zn-dependent alcohol dehydrogenase
VGDHVGIGWYIDSCLNCGACANFEENVCENGNTFTACGPINYSRVQVSILCISVFVKNLPILMLNIHGQELFKNCRQKRI